MSDATDSGDALRRTALRYTGTAHALNCRERVWRPGRSQNLLNDPTKSVGEKVVTQIVRFKVARIGVPGQNFATQALETGVAQIEFRQRLVEDVEQRRPAQERREKPALAHARRVRQGSTEPAGAFPAPRPSLRTPAAGSRV